MSKPSMPPCEYQLMSPSDLRERDLDLLLREELYVSEEFQQFFFSVLARELKASPARSVDAAALREAELESVRHSVRRSDGESDLEVQLNCSGKSIRILVEDKIDAKFQNQQAERYLRRGELYVDNKECEGFVTVLVAPNQYLAGAKHGFDLTIGLEEILEWFGDRSDPRWKYKASLIKSFIDKAKKDAEKDKKITKFWAEYYALASNIARPLKMPQPGGHSGGFLFFNPDGMPRYLSLVHKLNKGYVDLQFARLKPAFDEFEKRIRAFLESGMYCEVTGGSVSVRVKVDKLATSEEFSSRRDEAERGIRSANRLWNWFQQHEGKIKDIYTSFISQPK